MFKYIVLVFLLQESEAVNFLRQRGTFSGLGLCTEREPASLTRVSSRLKCFERCLFFFSDSCRSVKYLRDEKLCFLYIELLSRPFSDVKNGSCTGYQLLPDCPKGFVYIIELNRCWRLTLKAMNWSTSSELCRSSFANAHLVTIRNVTELSLLRDFSIKSSSVMKNLTNYFAVWTAGHAWYKNSVRQSFQWIIPPNANQTLEKEAPWSSGEPNSSPNTNNDCILAFPFRGLNDDNCGTPFCSVCEIAPGK